jgi:oligosaccharide translocation protein RFT1
MACRIVWCWVFIRGYFRRRGVGGEFELLRVMPSATAMLAGAVASQVARGLVGLGEGVAAGGAGDAVLALAKIAAVALPFVTVV